MTSTTSAWAITKTYTTDGDFDEGSLLNVNHTIVSDQLQLNQFTATLPFLYVACSQRGTVVRIDINTGAILGEYLTAPTGMGRNPSRTTVDKYGNVWVSNRDEAGSSGGQNKGSVMRVGVVIGGTRVNADGSPNPTGQYLKPPFVYSTCADRDGDGLIKTSYGLSNILPWTNLASADSHGGIATAEDECILNYTRVTGTNTRTVAVDRCNDVWVGGLGDLDHEKLSGVTGQPIPATQFNSGCGGYGGLIDGNNVLWSARGGSGLLRHDATSMTPACLGNGCGDYGLGVDPATGNIWQTDLEAGTVSVISPSGACLATYGHGNTYAQGVVVDNSSNVWVAHSLIGGSMTVGHLRTDGTFVGNVSLPGGSGPTGVAVDGNGKVWVTNINSNNAMRIDPSAGAIGGGGHRIGAVDMVVNLGLGAGPYNYSDMTGFVSIGATAPSGTWTVVYDGGIDAIWDDVSWTASYPSAPPCDATQPPPPPFVGVEVRAASDRACLPNNPFVAVANGNAIQGIEGRFIEIRATLSRPSISTPSPILSDLTVNGHPDSTPPQSFTITASAGPGGTISPSGVVTVDDCKSSQTYLIVPAECYEITDVLVDDVSVGAVASYSFTNVTANHSIVASFASIATTFTITASAGTGGTINPNGIVTVCAGRSYTFTIVPDECRRITDVIVDGVSVGEVASYTFTNVGANHTISASFELATIRLFAFSEGNGTVTLNPVGDIVGGRSNQPRYPCGTVVTLTATPAPEWHFTDWSRDTATTASSMTVTMRTPKVFVAKFVPPYEASEGGGNGTPRKMDTGNADPTVPGGAPPTDTRLLGLTNNPLRSGHIGMRFSLAHEDRVTIQVFDISGRLVRTVDAGILPAGEHNIPWDGSVAGGNPPVRGVYFVKFTLASSGVLGAKRLVILP